MTPDVKGEAVAIVDSRIAGRYLPQMHFNRSLGKAADTKRVPSSPQITLADGELALSGGHIA